MSDQMEIKIQELQVQIKEIQEAHNKLRAHYYDFVENTIKCFKDLSEREEL